MTKLLIPALLVLAALSASSAPAGGPILCSARTLSARAGLQGAAGTLEGGVTVTNRRPYPCTMTGRASVLFIHGGSGLGVKRVVGTSTTGERDPRTFTLVSGQKAFVRLRWANWCGKRYAYVGLLVSLKAHQPRLIVDGTTATPPCLKRGADSLLAVGPWESR